MSKKAESKTVHGIQEHANYPGASAAIRRGYSIGALFVAGFVKVEKGILKVTGKGDYKTFRAITQGKASRKFPAKLTGNPTALQDLITKSQDNAPGTNGYRADLFIMSQFITGMKHGGTIVVQDKSKEKTEKVSFVPVTVK